MNLTNLNQPLFDFSSTIWVTEPSIYNITLDTLLFRNVNLIQSEGFIKLRSIVNLKSIKFETFSFTKGDLLDIVMINDIYWD